MALIQNVDESRRLLMRARDSACEFLRTELLLAMTFARVASGAPPGSKRQRNIANATKALRSVEYFVERLHLNEWQKQEIAREIRYVEDVVNTIRVEPPDAENGD